MDNGFRRDMNTIDAYGNQTGAGSVLARNAVLRNTYWLLALSLIPTILGAWLGVALNIGAALHGGVGTVVFLVGAFGLMYGIQRTKESGLGVVLLLAFTFFMGLMLSRMLAFVLGMSNGASLITLAFGGTALIFAGMATIATVSKRDFSGMGKWLFAGVLMILIASVANIFLQLPAMMLAISVIAIVIFSAFMLFDVQRVVNGGETNYISATLAIYLDLYNVFVNLLMILGIFGGSSRD
jgi:modulator of FtsH protease